MCRAVLAFVVLAVSLEAGPAMAYVEPAYVLLEKAAARRADLGFATLVAEGRTPDGTAVWTAIRSGRAVRIEIRHEDQPTEVEVTRGRARYRFEAGAADAKATNLAAAPLLELLGTASKDPAGRRGLAMLERMGVDTSRVRIDLFDGHPAYVIGAERGDETTPQLWLDKRLLVPVRWVLPGGEDVRLYGYHQPTTGPWFPERIVRQGGGSDLDVIYMRVRFHADVPRGTFEVPL